MIHCSLPWSALSGSQPATRSGRFQLLPLPPFLKVVPDSLMLSIKGTGNPEEILSIRVTWKLPRMALVTVIPTAAELLSAAEGQIVNHAAGEAVIEIDLRQGPIQLLPVGKREKGGAESRNPGRRITRCHRYESRCRQTERRGRTWASWSLL